MRFVIVLLFLFPLMPIDTPAQNDQRPDHHTETGFRNPWLSEEDSRSFLDFLKWQWDRRIVRNVVKADRYNFDVVHPDYVNPPERVYGGILTWVGHATFLLQIGGKNILTDPVWSDRVGPASFLGPKRYTPPGIPWEKLPPIDVVVISHNHYDHMDRATIERLEKDFSPAFFVPLGNKKLLDEWKITNVIEHDWWEGTTIDDFEFVCTPTQHFSQRWLNDRNETLWASWIIRSPNGTVYFAGDTGYFPGFVEIGERFGPIDVALIPIGAYKPRWFMRPVHVDPAEALQAYIDLNARYFAAMHWGTFDQADEHLDEPPRDLMQALDTVQVDKSRIWVFGFGETRSIPPRNDE